MKNKPITIVDTSTLLPGPFATYLLQKHLSAKVIKVEDIRLPDKLSEVKPTKEGESLIYQAINENKIIIKVDYSGSGTQEVKKLIGNADVFITNLKPARAQKLGLSAQDITKHNRDIIYCSISGYPHTHPLSGFAAHDINILALSGYLSLNHLSEGVMSIPSVQLADLFTSYHSALRITSALLKGIGSVIKVSMYEATLEAIHLYRYPQIVLGRTIIDELSVQNHTPCYHIYRAKNGYVVVGAIEGSYWVDLCHILRRNDLIPRQFDENVIPELEKEIAKKPKEFFLAHDVCTTPVLTVNEAKKMKLA